MTNIAIAELDSHSIDLSTVKFTAEQFERVCEANPDRSFELTAQGVLLTKLINDSIISHPKLVCIC
jgi:Uma2 family endonuclease